MSITAEEALMRLDESSMSGFQLKMVITAGMGFFTDAYDLFIIGVVSSILQQVWHISALQVGLLNSTALLSAALGAIIFGRVADQFGRKFIYGYELLVLAAGAIASALTPPVFWLLLVFRFILGLGIGGDYPVSSTLMSEYSNRRDRGKLITMVFSTQALGLIIGPILALLLISAGLNADLIWRLLLAFGAVPALATFWLRRSIAESPRFALQSGNANEVHRAVEMALGKQAQKETANASTGNSLSVQDSAAVKQATQSLQQESRRQKLSWHTLFTVRHFLLWIIGTAGTWFLLDIAYYGTTVSTPFVIKLFRPNATLAGTMLYTLLIFVVAALPGYILSVFTVDKLGRKTIQLIGFAMMALSYGTLFLFPAFTTMTAPFLLAYGLSYLFTEFGPNVTTFLYPAEIFPVSVRTTAHGIAAASGKIGAFIGAFIFPQMLSNANFGLPGAMGVAAGICVVGFLLTFLLPEPKQKSLETIEREGEEMDRRAKQRNAVHMSL